MSTKSFSDFDLIWCVGRPRPDVRTSVTSTRTKVKVKATQLRKSSNWLLVVIVWDLVHSLSEPDFRISF